MKKAKKEMNEEPKQEEEKKEMEEETEEEKACKEDMSDPELSKEELQEAVDDFKRKRKLRMKQAEEDEEEDMEKQEENPEQSASSGTDDNSTISPNAGVPSTQNVFVPNSNISVGRNATNGIAPSDVSYSGKSVNPDLAKSPLFVELSKNIDGIRLTMSKKIEAIEKSINDRLDNLMKTVNRVEKFYDQPLYKSMNENLSQDTVKSVSLKDKAEYSFN